MHVESHVPYFHIAHHTSDLDTKIYAGTVLKFSYESQNQVVLQQKKSCFVVKIAVSQRVNWTLKNLSS